MIKKIQNLSQGIVWFSFNPPLFKKNYELYQIQVLCVYTFSKIFLANLLLEYNKFIQEQMILSKEELEF